MRIWIFFLSLFLLSAFVVNGNCSPENNWRGKNKSSLIQHFGQPSYSYAAPNGNTIYVYIIQSRTPYPSPSTPRAATIVVPGGRAVVAAPAPPFWQTDTQICTKSFEIDKNSKIVGVEYSGIYCDLN